MLRDIRTDYNKYVLEEKTISKNPFEQLQVWLNEALKADLPDATAMVLSTIDREGNPESRVVLLKELSAQGLVFFTNYNSKKGKQIGKNNRVSVVFFWPELERQVRIKGKAEKVSDKESEIYYQSRPVDSRLGAWASPQSQVIENRDVLDSNYNFYREHFKGLKIEKPPHWGGYLIRPEYFEFWQGRSNRLHDRLEFSFTDGEWEIHRLAP